QKLGNYRLPNSPHVRVKRLLVFIRVGTAFPKIRASAAIDQQRLAGWKCDKSRIALADVEKIDMQPAVRRWRAKGVKDYYRSQKHGHSGCRIKDYGTGALPSNIWDRIKRPPSIEQKCKNE